MKKPNKSKEEGGLNMDQATQPLWQIYNTGQFYLDGNKFRSSDGEWLFLYEHPIAGWFGGVRESNLDPLRSDFSWWLRKQLLEKLSEPAPRGDKLRITGKLLFHLLHQSPPSHDWLRLPADSRPGRNHSTIAYHSLLVAAFACAMVRAWLLAGKPVSELLRFQAPRGEQEQPLNEEELIQFTRIAAVCHDFGKHPPMRHNLHGKEQVYQLFTGLMDKLVVFCLSEVAYRHHTGRSYRLRDESPIGPLEELIAHSDTLASAADRPVSDADPSDPVEAVTQFLQDELGDQQALSLISADTDRVKSYVFESARLPEVRGASGLLTRLNEKKICELLWNCFQLPPECLLYAAGGSALIIVPTQLADNIADSIQRLYLDETRAVTISVVHRPCLPKEWVKGIEASKGNFGNLVKWMSYDLRRAKESRAFYPFFATTPHMRRCDSCEVRPATKPMERAQVGEENKWVCDVCHHKRRWGKSQKSRYIELFEDFLEGNAGARKHIDGKYWQTIVKHGGRNRVIGAKTLEEIGRGAEGKAQRYVGIIYTDGNDIGARLERSETPAEYRTLSEELLRVTREATFKSLAGQVLLKEIKCSDGEKRWVHPFEIVAIGGDDVFLIVPGDVALDVAAKLCQEFQHQFNGKLTMSAGVLIMPEHFPIYYARNIVELLLKNAKKAGRKAVRSRGEPPPAYIDFQVITGDTSLSTNLDYYREQVYSGAKPFRNMQRLTQRPYQLEQLQHLLEVVRWVKRDDFPISQLFLLRQAVVEHLPAWSRNWYRYQLGRGGEISENWSKFHRQLFNTEPFSDPHSPWRYKDGEWCTPIVDLVEILDYVRPGGKGNEAGD
jgi:CRISPR-associated protein Cmr2